MASHLQVRLELVDELLRPRRRCSLRPNSTSVWLRSITSTKRATAGRRSDRGGGELGLDVGDELRHRLLRRGQLGRDRGQESRCWPGCRARPCRCRRHSGEFTHQLIQATAASGFLVLADADHSMRRLVPGLPVGGLAGQAREAQHLHLFPRRRPDRSPAGWSCRTAWRRSRATTALWSSGLADGPCPSSLICCGRSDGLGLLELDHQLEPRLGVGDLEPGPFRSEQLLAVLPQPGAEHRVLSRTSAPRRTARSPWRRPRRRRSIISSQVQVLSSGMSILAFSKTSGWRR